MTLLPAFLMQVIVKKDLMEGSDRLGYVHHSLRIQAVMSGAITLGF